MRPIEKQQAGKHDGRPKQPWKIGRMPVKDGDNEYGDDVVGNSKCRQKHFEAGGHPASKKCKDAQRKRNVGGHGNAPARGGRQSTVECRIDGNRHRNATDGCYYGQQCLSDIDKLAHCDLILDLKPHDKEEDGHQGIVDKGAERQAKETLAHCHAKLSVPKRLVRFNEAAVCDDECNNGCKQHDACRYGRGMRELHKFSRALTALINFLNIQLVGHNGPPAVNTYASAMLLIVIL